MTLPTDASGPREPRRVSAPWGESAGPADTAIALLLGLCVVYSLVLWPLVPALIGSHPLLLEILSGSTLAEVTVGAHSRLGELPLWFAVVVAVPGSMMFDWVFWWAGAAGVTALCTCSWAALLAAGGREAEARSPARAHGGRFGPAAIVLAYYLPLPTLLIYAASGLPGMRLRTFLALDLSARCCGSGRCRPGLLIGQPAVDVVHRIDHYSPPLTSCGLRGDRTSGPETSPAFK